jgi:L-alanine-DL-glutamate epimerase-like enolase superfamily enzyme
VPCGWLAEGKLQLPGGPGLGWTLDEDYVGAHLVELR